uniref:Uncharacterized protein n=1 Tax=Oreochromis aureus TaxID=47969 RepID=A0AAZ1XRD9_OREAU
HFLQCCAVSHSYIQTIVHEHGSGSIPLWGCLAAGGALRLQKHKHINQISNYRDLCALWYLAQRTQLVC